MNFLKILGGDEKPKALICPHCERPLDENHVEETCKHKMSRRFFVGMLSGCVAVAATGSLEKAIAIATPHHIAVEEAKIAASPYIWMVNGNYVAQSRFLAGSAGAVQALKRRLEGAKFFYSESEAYAHYWSKHSRIQETGSGLLIVDRW